VEETVYVQTSFIQSSVVVKEQLFIIESSSEQDEKIKEINTKAVNKLIKNFG
jgi:hypothetical protein|tara:strand:+ start:541 stop:696 length:156 start_codon:yes stop_codon:yes gene_type:complete